MKKRIISLLLAIIMVAGMLPAGGLQILACATENQEVSVDGTSICEAHIWNDGFCACGGYQSAYYNEETGVYEISNAGQLYWYAQYLNETNAEIYAKLTADITIPENAPNWQPINSSYAYFDGNFKTISGLKCVGGDVQYVGLFGRENWWYEISNLHITNSYFEGSANVGAVVAELTNGGSVTNCYVTNTTVTGDGDCIGSLVGSVSMGHVINCYTDSNTLVGYRNPNYGTIENSYYLSTEETEDGGKTAAQFASGEVAFLLQAGQQPGYDYDEEGNQIEVPAAEIWDQNIGVDAFPVLGGQKVNYGYVSCAGDAQKVYTNAVAYSEKPEHSGEIEYTPNADGTTHSGVYSCFGDAVNENETHTQPLAWVNQGEAGHISYYPCCQTAEDVATVSHSYDEATLLCGCGQTHPDAVILLSVDGISVCAFTDMDTAAGNAQNYTAEDNAVLKLLKSVDLGDKEVIFSGVYTLDLNGFTVTSTVDSCGVFCVFGEPELTVCNGTIVGRNSGIQLEGGKLIVSDVIFLEADRAIAVLEGEIILRQCDIQATDGIYINSGSAAVYDSTFAADCDINFPGEGTITFFEGTEFPGGLSVSGVYLENLLSEGMAYWRGNTMILPGEGATNIWSDVTVKAACTHENGTIVYIPKDRDSHLVAHSCCGIGHTEPHSLGDEGICTICGLDPANVITINMTDSFGDGWSGNAIQVYEDGILLYTVTCNEGSAATWAYAYNPEKEYEFRWVVGSYPHECSFEILFADETVFTATSVDCYGYPDGYRFYPVCQHVYDEGIVTAPECSRQGYTTYTCTLCGHYYQDDFVTSLGGHIKAEGDEGIVTAPNCVDEGYTTYTCARCGESFQDDYVDPVGHVLGEDGNCTTCGSLYTVPVYVADELITFDNMADVQGDGTVSYDPATNTLTVNGYRGGDIYSEIPLNILLLGENTIETSQEGIACNFTTGTVSISGTGSLDIISKREAVAMSWDNGILIIGGSVTLNLMTESQGIFLYADTADLVIRDNATVIMGTDDAPMQKEGIYVRGRITGSVTITDNASITCVSNDEEGIYVSGTTESVTISGNAKVYVVGDKEGLDANTITVSGGTVTAIGGVDCEGIFADDLTITGGTVTASGDDQGIEAENITITGGTVIVTGGGMFASAVDMTPGTITLGQGMAITAPEGATLGELDLTAEDEGVVLAVLNPDGTMAETLGIEAVCDHIDTDNSGRCDLCDGLMESAKPVMTGKAFSLSFEDEIRVNFYYTVSDATYITEHGMLVFYSDPGAVDFSKADAVYNQPISDPTEAYYGVSTAGIAAKEMGDTRYYVAYAKLDDGSYVYSNIYGYSPRQYAMNMLGRSTTSDKQKVLCVALLNFGAAAQEYFGYKTDALMNAELTDEQKALVVPYDKTLFTGAVEAEESKLGAFAATATGFSEMGATVSLEGAFSVNYYITPDATVDRDMTLYIWTPEAYAAADTLTADNASETMTMVARSDGSYWGQVSNIAAKCLDDTYYVAAVYTGADGNTYCTGVIAYSVSQYCLNKAVDGSEMQQLAGATAMYGYYAKQYFAN